MINRQLFLKLKKFLTATFFLAVLGAIVFAAPNGDGTTAGTNETLTNPPVSDSKDAESGKEKAAATDVDAPPPSGNSAQQEKNDETPVPARPERTMSIGIRKVYAPESEVQQWPLGNRKYTFINSQKFESKYKLWKEILSDISSDLHSSASRSDVCIESARYYGTVSDSGELSGWGEWKVIVNRQIQDESIELGAAVPDSDREAGKTAEKSAASDSSSNEIGIGQLKTELFLNSKQEILLSDFVFYDASIKNLPEPKDEWKTEESSLLQVDPETRYPVDKDVVSACFSDGQTVLYIPSAGTVRFRWKAKRLGTNDYLIQAPNCMELNWTIDVPSDQKLSMRSENSDCVTEPLCASITKEKVEGSDSWRYSIRWSESETAILHIGSADEKENRFDRFYQQQTTYTFSPYHLNTQCRITFEPDSRSALPQEIPFTVVHDPHVVWEASFDGQPAEIHITETGYSVLVRNCKIESPRPELVLTSNCPLGDVKKENRESKNENESSSGSSSLSLPRIELQSGRWQSGTAVIYTLQSPKSIETDKCNVIDCKRVALRRFQTIVEQETPEADVVLVIEPYQELFYSQTQTTVQWDGSQASFISTIELQAEEGRLYSLTAVLPEGLTIDQASAEEQPDLIEDWEVNADADNPARRTLTIYLRKSVSPGRSLVLNIRSHAIADWSKPIELNRLAPIVFDGFESHTQILYVNVALNQRFIVGERVLYSPEQGALSDEPSDDLSSELPIGIDCAPHSSTVKGTGTGRIDAYEFCIDLKIWGRCLASLEPVQSEYAVNAKTTIWVDKNSMEEGIELAFSGERSHLSQFRFSYGHSSDAPGVWQGLLVWSDNRYKVKVEKVEGNVFSIEIPRNVSSPFTVYLSRKIDWNQQRAFEVLGSRDCSRLTASVSVHSRLPRLFDIHAYGMKFVKNGADDNADFTIGTYEYDVKVGNQESGNKGESAPSASDSDVTPRIEISSCQTPPSDVSIWAWNQFVEERHFISGNVLTSAQWTIENRFPSQDSIQASDASNTRLKITLPTDSTADSGRGSQTFLTGVRIDNESVSGEDVIQESANSFCILLPPKKKAFVLTVQWTSFDRPLKTFSSFRPQKPILDIVVLQSSWDLYYPTCYRRLNSFTSSDPSVDGWLERFFGPLLRRDSVAIMSIVSHIWDTDQDDSDVKKEAYENNELGNGIIASPASVIKPGSNAVFPDPGTLPGAAPWNCCRFDGSGAPNSIQIVRSEVSECIRWTFFIITISIILALYFKRADLIQSENSKSENSEEEPVKGIASWGFRRWVCVFGIASCILCQALPWFLSLFFSGAFLGAFVCLLVLAVPIGDGKANNGEDSNSIVRSSLSMNVSSRLSISASRFLILAAVLTTQLSYGQEPPATDSRYMPSAAPERREFEIFVPVDQQNRPKSGYYVPQELLDLMQTRANPSLQRSWIVCRTQYFGKLFQKSRQTESGLWRCALEIETIIPDAAVELPIQLLETVSTTSSVSVSRGRILKSASKADETNSDDSKSETLYWSWDKLDNQTVLLWNPQKERWGIRLAQPGRYLIEAEFRPTISVKDGKNEISFPILECVNAAFELLVPENVTGLEFPDAFGEVAESASNMEITDPSLPAQPGVKLKQVQLGAAKQLTVRWNAGGFLSDGPVYDVDTITWWNVTPESVDVKIKYNVKVVSGSVSSVKIKMDDRLALLSESVVENKDAQNEDAQNEKESKEKNNQKTESDALKSENPENVNNELDSPQTARGSSTKTNGAALPSGVHYSVISNPVNPSEITVEFDSPVTSQTSFELHYIWKDAVGVGRLQFPTTSVESSRSGQRSLAFSFDSRLHYECASDSLSPMPVQSFWELWRGFQKQNASVSGKEASSTDRANVRPVAESVSNNNTESDSVTKKTALPATSQTSDNLPTVAYDLNLSRRKTDSSGVVDSVVMNVQRTKASSEGTAEAFVLVDWNRLLWQIKWTINITRGERNSYIAILPESMCKLENHLSIISASVNVLDSDSGRLHSVSAGIEGNELKLYWGTPVEGKCQLTVTGEIRPDFANGKTDALRKIDFDFPEIKTLNVTQYKLAIGRTDNCIVKTVFERPAAKTVVWTQAELSVETPFSSRNQRLLETWQSTITDASKKPCALALEIQKNEVSAEIDASVKLASDSAMTLVINGRVKVTQGILDEFLLDVPENCFAPISLKTTLKCELDALSITQRRYILRPLSPFSSDSEFELTIPLKKAETGSWKLEKRGASLWSVVRSGSAQQTEEQASEQESDKTASSDNPKDASAESASLDSVTKAFGLKMFVKPVSESEYCASAEFACCVSGTDGVCVRLPKGGKTLNVQIDQRSVRWVEKSAGEALIPMFTENDPVDIRIVYTAPFNRTLYTDPMKFEPPTIDQAQQPEILWMVIPWKNLGHADPGVVRTTSFINKQIWLINDLNSQFQFLQQSAGNFSPIALERLSGKLDEIETQLKQYELRGEKPKTKMASDGLIPKPEIFRRPNLTATETGAIRLAMQNVLRLREAINEKQRKQNKKTETVNSYNVSSANSELLEIQSSTASPLVGTTSPGTTFVMTYSLPPAAAPNASIWQMLSLLVIPIVIWLAFFPPESFILWRPAFVLGCLSVIWLLCFNIYSVAILLFIGALFDALNKFRQHSKRNIISLRVR